MYVFGAHIFAQYLFAFGLDQTKIISLLYNSGLKKEKRLYGTDLIVHGPEILRGKGKVGVVLKVGIYRDEILEQLQEMILKSLSLNSMVTAVCNIFINSDLKLELFKQTFPRVYDISDNWLINIRGKYRQDVEIYSGNFCNSGSRIVFFSPDSMMVIGQARKMLKSSKYDYVYIFLEDHFLLRPLDHFKDVVRDMIDLKSNISDILFLILA